MGKTDEQAKQIGKHKENTSKMDELQEEAEQLNVSTEKRKQKKSVSYALKAIGTHLGTLVENELLTENDMITIGDIVTKAKKKWINQEYGI